MLNISLPYDPAILLTGMHPKRNKNVCLHRTYKWTFKAALFLTAQKVTTQTSFGGRLGKADVIDSCDGILSDNKKEHITEKCYNMTNLKNVMLSGRIQTQNHISYDSMYMKFPEKSNF